MNALKTIQCVKSCSLIYLFLKEDDQTRRFFANEVKKYGFGGLRDVVDATALMACIICIMSALEIH